MYRDDSLRILVDVGDIFVLIDFKMFTRKLLKLKGIQLSFSTAWELNLKVAK